MEIPALLSMLNDFVKGLNQCVHSFNGKVNKRPLKLPVNNNKNKQSPYNADISDTSEKNIQGRFFIYHNCCSLAQNLLLFARGIWRLACFKIKERNKCFPFSVS